MAETFASEGAVTVFAPTDDAFAALPETTLALLLEDPQGDLINTLLYHVVEGAVKAEDVVELTAAPYVLGQDITIAVDGEGRVFLNGNAQVVITDIEASNGVTHVKDVVLDPTNA